MRICLIICDGVSLRNFVLSKFYELASLKDELVIWHSLDQKILTEYQDFMKPSVKWVKLPDFKEGYLERIFRQAKVYAQLYSQRKEKGSQVLLKAKKPFRGMSSLFTKAAQLLGFFMGFKKGVIFLDRLHAFLAIHRVHMRYYLEEIKKINPDVVLCTHQRSSLAVLPMLASKKQNIPAATFIYSWDNIPKGRMIVHAKNIFVWSQEMKSEVLRYYSDAQKKHIHIVGSPQFEFYQDKSLKKKKEKFFKEMKLNIFRKVICFSGDDITTSPYDPFYLADLAKALREIDELERPQILFRRCPSDSSERYKWVLNKYDEIVDGSPMWLKNKKHHWASQLPTKDDIALLVNTAMHCDAVINIGSTMAMDFAICGKPSIYINYNQPDISKDWDIKRLYKLTHFNFMHKVKPVHWVHHNKDLKDVVIKVLENPQEKKAERNLWVKQHALHPLDKASERIYNELQLIGNYKK